MRRLSRLPIDDVLPSVLDALAERPNLALRAATGAGKTTRVPPALADRIDGQIVMLEPRRVAARAAARRIAEENGWRLGEEVGYHIRFDRKATRRTRVLVVTEGILVQRLQADPFLDGVGAVIFDELHERNLQGDLALAMARKVQLEVRDDLRLIAMSATLDPEPLVRFLGGSARCSHVESDGRLFPVDVEFLPGPDARAVPVLVRQAVESVLDRTDGGVLVFLPGVGEIRRSREMLEPIAQRHGLALYELYGDLPPERQDAALRPGDRRKVVLATNVAETSVTVDGVTTVIDSGLVRSLRFDPNLGLDRLELGRISRASAEQRKGRAGRQAPGLCLRLWTEHDDRSLAARDVPEIRRLDLTGPVLELRAWGEADPEQFPWFEAPDPAALDRAGDLLRDLGAVDAAGGLTAIGRALARLPVHPRLGRMVIEGRRFGRLDDAALLAALVAERDVVFRPTGQRRVVARTSSPSDLIDRLDAVRDLDRSGYGETALGPVDRGRARQALRVARQIAQAAKQRLEPLDEALSEDPTTDLLRSIHAAYPDRVARRREPGSRRALMTGGKGIKLAEMSAVHNDPRAAECFVAVELDAGRGAEALVRRASAIDREWLRPTTTTTEAIFDPERQRVVGRNVTRYRDLVLAEATVDPGPERAAEVLAEAAATALERALPLDQPAVATCLARLRALAVWRPDLELPTVDDDALRALLPLLCQGRRSFDELRRAPLVDILRGTMDFRQLDALDRHAPETWTVPSGSRLRLDYSPCPQDPPVLAVRIQEMFGATETPAVAGGKVPVMLHLLAPNGRPQQITRDLVSFWINTYPEVRKELAGRYPKHAWPDDPTTAEPMRGAKRRRR